MNRIEFLLKVLDSTFDKESWYAPLKHAMEGITAEQASWRPPEEAAKTIWENVNHLIYYKERLVANMEGRDWTLNLSGDENFYLTEQSNEEKDWKKVVERAETAHLNLRKILSETAVEELEQNGLEGKLLDIFLHDAYHTGQMIQIRKMQGSWPSHR
ncbi:DinB family protein [Peribacillus frigoritolerans]|uniref:DinB family protein n=1 Tax=Peribacillus frigoritolerans TaxID=450367 RepID=UPI0010599E3F|nr:DinB family protein [Peribacillus frigoritolerans]TDL82884.1 DinB family protein [Peribacillus frigoritolerans]